jgi:RNA recognition motif-containing protein
VIGSHPQPESISQDPFRIVCLAFEAEAEKHHMARKLYVGNLPYDTAEQDLQSLFAEAGTVDSVNLMRDMATGRARGFAFIEMSTDEEAQSAISKFNDYQLGGRNLTVNEAKPKTGGGGFGGGGGYGDGGRRKRSEPRW